MRKIYFIFICVELLALNQMKAQAPVKLDYDFSQYGTAISPILYGIFFEDINFAADGGLYAEKVRNRSFEEGKTYWSPFAQNGSSGTFSIETQNLLNPIQTRCAKLTADSVSSNSYTGIRNNGFWGIHVTDKTEYTLTFFAKASEGFNGMVKVALENNNGSVIYAQQRMAVVSAEWKKYSCTLVASGSNAAASLSLSINNVGTVWIDVVSLFPPTFKGRNNGTRLDIAEKINKIHPKFMRFPGGCFVEGDVIANRFQWKNTIGKIEERAGHNNIWGYRTSDGMGFHEFLQFAEDIGAEPLYVMSVGVAHNNYIAYNNLTEEIQNELDAIEYANGPITSTYGAMRAANGHPEPFNLKYIEIGNENNQHDNVDTRSNHYGDRYIQFYNAIKEKYPDMVCIGNVEAWGTDFPSWQYTYPVDILDEHYYRDPKWFLSKANKYDSYSRAGSKIYVGEYAVTSGSGNGNLAAALGEAAFMTGLERNSDIVSMASYAPLLANINQPQWNPDVIYYNSEKLYGTPSYYVQCMFSSNIGNKYIPVKDSFNVIDPKFNFAGAVGVGSWSTVCQYDSVIVTSNDSTIVNENFDTNASGWNNYSGTWAIVDGTYKQTSTNTDCWSTFGNISLHKYTYKLKARKLSGAEGFLIIFGGTDNNNFYWWNIGGWSNTQSAIEHCVNGAKSIVVTAPQTINSNQWYNIQIDINEDTVGCYLDNKLVFKFVNPTFKSLYTSCTTDTINGDIYLKVVNFNSTKTACKIAFSNLPENTRLQGIVETLAYTSTTTENSINNPFLISPDTTAVAFSGTSFDYTFAQNSINVFHLYPQSTLINVDSSSFSIPENSQNGLLVGTISTKGAGKFKFEIVSSSVKGAIIINDSTGKIYVLDSSLLNYEINPVIKLDISAKDISLATSANARGICQISLTNVNESAVLLPNKYYTYVNDSNGTAIGKIYFQDVDKHQTYSFSIVSQSENSLIKINNITGELTLNNASVLNSLALKSATFIVEITDNGSPALSSQKEYTLEILDKPFSNSVKKKFLSQNIEVYPNPAQNIINIKVETVFKKMSIKIIDLKGVEQINQNINNSLMQISTSNLTKGVYYVQILTEGQVVGSTNIEIVK